MYIENIIHYNKFENTNDVLLDVGLKEEEKQKIHKYYLEHYSNSKIWDYNVQDVSLIVFVMVEKNTDKILSVDTYFYPSDFGECLIKGFLSEEDIQKCIRYVQENFIGKEHQYKHY